MSVFVLVIPLWQCDCKGSGRERRKPKLWWARGLHQRCDKAVLPGVVRALRIICLSDGPIRSHYLSNCIESTSVIVLVADTHFEMYITVCQKSWYQCEWGTGWTLSFANTRLNLFYIETACAITDVIYAKYYYHSAWVWKYLGVWKLEFLLLPVIPCSNNSRNRQL